MAGCSIDPARRAPHGSRQYRSNFFLDGLLLLRQLADPDVAAAAVRLGVSRG